MDNERLTGKELRIIRTLRNIRQYDVGEMINRTSSSIAQLENEHRKSLDGLQSKIILENLNINSELLSSIRQTIKQGAK